MRLSSGTKPTETKSTDIDSVRNDSVFSITSSPDPHAVMKITVITPVYNDPRIERCLRSVKGQRRGVDVEHIVVDSNSTDETIDIIEKYDDYIDVLVREDDNGMYDAVNKGIQRATGDVIGILNSDDRYQDETVLKSVAEAFTDPNVGACYGNLVYVNDQDEVVRYWKSGHYKTYKFYLGWMPPHPTFYARSELYENLGMYDDSIAIAADYDLMLRFLLDNNIRVQYIDRTLVRMTLGGMSNASMTNVIRGMKDIYRAWDKQSRLGKYLVPILHPIEKIPQLIRSPPG